MTLSGIALPPFLISTTQNPTSEVENSKIVMLYWIKQILIPHVTHNVTHFLQSQNIRVLSIPPHSSHLLQILDISFFGIMKKSYKLY